MSGDSSEQMLLLSRLADEFAARYRKGERPPLSEYIDRHPELAAAIREFFPAMVELEQVQENRREVEPAPALPAPPLERLGDYRIVREIGRGGMGVVYEAVQISLGRPVALKVLPRQAGTNQRAWDRFRREAQAAGRLHHTNIVPVFGVGVDGDTSYYAMQLIVGQPLDQVVTELRRFRAAPKESTPALSRSALGVLTGEFRPPPEVTEDHSPAAEPVAPVASATRVGSGSGSSAVLPRTTDLSSAELGQRHYFESVARIGHQAASALAHAHARGIIHRDIKPSNLLLDTFGVVWITDFGLARTEEDGLTATGDIVGTLRYMSPERFNGQCDARADVYALGATLYELLVLKPAFDSPDRLRLLRQIQSQEPLRPRALDPRIPRDLETIVLTAMSREPARRYPSAEALAADLERYVAGEPIRARRVSELEKAALWARRRPAIAGLLALVFLTVVAGLVLVGWQWRRAEHEWQRAEDKANAESQARSEAEKQQAHLALARGVNLCEQGEVEQGLLWLARALELAERGGVSQLERPLRVQLSDWSRQLPLLLRQWRHLGGCNQLCFSPDGRLLATAGKDGRVCFWDVNTGKEDGLALWQYSPPAPRNVWDVAFSPDGKTLLSSGGDGKAVLWDVATRQRRHILAPGGVGAHSNVWAAVFNPDGSLVATGGPGDKIHLWNTATGAVVAGFSKGRRSVRSVAFSADSRFLYAGDFEDVLRRWDVNTRESPDPPLLQRSRVQVLQVSPDGKWGLAGGHEGGLHLWDCETLRLYQLPFQGVPVDAGAFSPGGRIFATSAGGVVRLWDTWNRRPVGALLRHDDRVKAMAFSPDGQTLAVGEENGEIRLMMVPRLDARPPVARTEAIRSLSLDRAGSQLLVADHASWTLHDATKENMPVLVGPVSTGPEREPIDREIITGTLSPDGRTLVTSRLGEAVLWDIATRGRRARTSLHQADITELIFLADGSTLLTYSKRTSSASRAQQHRAGLWEVPTGRLLRSFVAQPEAEVNRAAVANGRLVLLGCGDRTARFFDVETNEWVGEPLQHASAVTAVAFRADGACFLTGCRDGTLRLWDTQTRKPLTEPMRHAREVAACAFSPNGEWILAADLEGVARFWDPVSGQPLGVPLRHAGAIMHLAFHPDGQRVVTAGRDECVRQWRVPPPPMTGSPEAIRLRIEALTGCTMDEAGAIRPLPSETSPDQGPLRKELLDEAVARSRKAVESEPKDVLVPREIAIDHTAVARREAAQGDWKTAASSYAKFFAEQPIADGEVGFEYATVLLLAGDEPGYRKMCAELVAHSGEAGIRPYHVARACTLAPNSVKDVALPAQLADDELQSNRGEFWSLTEQAALAYRAGRFEQAEPLLLQSLEADPQPTRAVLNWLWLCLVEQRRGMPLEARAWLEKATKWLAEYPTGVPAEAGDPMGFHLHNWLEAHVLHREAERALAPGK